MIHLADGAGLRETSARVKLAGLADISDVGILKRLKRCGARFEWMAQALRQPHASALAPILSPALSVIEPSTVVPANVSPPRRLCLVDGTMVGEPDYTGSK